MNWLKTAAGCFCFSILILFNISSQAAGADSTNSNIKPASLIIGSTSCTYYFSDSYYQANSATPPSVGGTGGEIKNYGPELSLRFNNTDSTYTPPVPCDGYYQVSVSINVRNNDGVGCSTGLNTIALAVTSTDPQVPNVYGCPVLYPNHCCLTGNSSCCHWYPYSVGYHAAEACTMTTQWVQCSWANNYDGQFWWDFHRTYSTYSRGYPMFSYTPYWPYYGNYIDFGPYYTGQCGYTGSGQPSTCQVGPYYQRVLGTPQQAYCSQKPIFFQKLIYLHKGAKISAPSLWSRITQSIYTHFGPGNIAACSMSVTGGQMKVFYLHP